MGDMDHAQMIIDAINASTAQIIQAVHIQFSVLILVIVVLFFVMRRGKR